MTEQSEQTYAGDQRHQGETRSYPNEPSNQPGDAAATTGVGDVSAQRRAAVEPGGRGDEADAPYDLTPEDTLDDAEPRTDSGS